MNESLLGFPGGSNQTELTGQLRWWNYITNGAQIPGLPSRVPNVWYYNNTGEPLDVSVTTAGGVDSGLELISAPFPMAGLTRTGANLGPDGQRYIALDAMYAATGSWWAKVEGLVDIGYWYIYQNVNTLSPAYTWIERRRKIG